LPYSHPARIAARSCPTVIQPGSLLAVALQSSSQDRCSQLPAIWGHTRSVLLFDVL